jgi:hypothetical protein
MNDDNGNQQRSHRQEKAGVSRRVGAGPLRCNIRSYSNDRYPVAAADYKQNPFTLVYGGAITKNELGKVNIHTVKYKLHGLDMVAAAEMRPWPSSDCKVDRIKIDVHPKIVLFMLRASND